MRRISKPGRRILWISLGVSLAVHLVAARLGFMPSLVSLLGHAGPALQDRSPAGMQVLKVADSNAPVKTPILPPDITPDGVVQELPVEFEFRPGGFDRGESVDGFAPPGLGSAVQPPVALTVPWLKYPPSAIRDKISGIVQLRVLVGVDGRVDRVEVVEGLRPDCDESAIDAARRLIFEPALEGGRRVSAWVEYEIAFDLGRER